MAIAKRRKKLPTKRGRRNGGAPRIPKRRMRRSHKAHDAPARPAVGTRERVLAFDSSSKACGWSVFDDGELVEFGRFLQIGEGHGERLMNFHAWVGRMLAEWKPDLLVYEAPYQGRMKNTFGILSRYVAMIEAAHFAHFGAEIGKTESVPAHLVKKAIGATRGADHDANKKIVLLMINHQFGLSLKYKSNDVKKTVSQDDDADAIAVNWAWHRLYRSPPEE